LGWWCSTIRRVNTESIAEIARRHPALELLVLFGSRARGEELPGSDWDFGFRGKPGIDRDGLFVDLVTACGSDRVDLVDLDRAGGLMRYRVCRDGTPLYEKEPGTFQHFWLQAVRFWCDAEPVLRRRYDDVLRGLTP
jgi:predicted nucleotidyltransferase